MQNDVNLRRYILQVFSSPNVVAFASERARNILDVEFGVSLSSLLRPLGVESPSKFLWPPDEASKKTREYLSDSDWKNRVCRESCPAFLSLMDVLHNKPKGSPRIWTPQNKIEYVTIRMQDRNYRNDHFEVKFVSLCDAQGADQDREDQESSCLDIKAIKSYDEFIKQFPYNDLILSSLLNSGSRQFESIFKEFLQKELEINANDGLVEFSSELPFWFERWLEAYNETFNCLNHESTSQPIGGIVFVDISEDDPIESIIEITNSLKTGKNFEKLGGNPGYYLFGASNHTGLIQDSSYLSDTGKLSKPHYLQESYLSDFPLIYIFINDEGSSFDLTETDHNIISSFKLSFPESICYIWNIKGHDALEEIQDPGKVVWPGTFSHPYKDLGLRTAPKRFFDCDEMEQLNSFVIDSIKNNFVPWLEDTINKLCNHVIQSRKGFKNHLRILWRRPRNDSGMNSDGLLSTLGVGSTFGNIEERSQIFDHEISLFSSKSSSNGSNNGKGGGGGGSAPTCVYYASGSLEGQTRLVADLCLVSGIYSQSIHYYKQILSEYKLDKSYLHIGSTFLSMAVAEILTDFDLETVSDYCMSSSNSFLRSKDDIGTISAIKSLLFLSFVILSCFKLRKKSQDHAEGPAVALMINNICKNIISSLSKISNEFQISQQTLRPRSLFSIGKMDSQDHSKDSVTIQYLSEDLKWVPTRAKNNTKSNSILSTFGVINYVVSRVIFLSSTLSDSSFRINPTNPTNIPHSWSIHTAQAAQIFQDLGFFGISLKHYLTTLLHMDRFSYKHIDRYLKLYSARLCQKLSLHSQSTLLYSSLILDIINDKISFDAEVFSNLVGSNFEPILFQINDFGTSLSIREEDTEISLICYREFIRSYIIYKQGVSLGIQNSEPCQLNNSPAPGTFLKIPLPILLPFGAVLILETDSDSLFKSFGIKENKDALNQALCSCNNQIQNIINQKNFCNHNSQLIKINVPGGGTVSTSSRSSQCENLNKPSSPRYYNSNRNEDDFQNLLDKVNRLLDSESISLESSEATELRSQYILRRDKENHWINSPKPPPLISSQFSNSVRFSFIGKVCSIEFNLYNPLSFPIVCESLQIWGHLRLHDGSTGITHTLKDETENYNNHKCSKGIIFFEKSTILNPNETKTQKLSVIPLEAGELFLVGISFLLDGKIPIRQNFGTSSISFDGLISNSTIKKDHFGIQKINILGHPNSSSIHFGNISRRNLESNNIIKLSQDHDTLRCHDIEDKKEKLHSGTLYKVPISILSNREGIGGSSLKDSVLLVIPYFSNHFNIQMSYRSDDSSCSLETCNVDTLGCIFKLPVIDVQQSHEFDLTLWVNSECSGNVYFVLLDSNSSDEHFGQSSAAVQSSRSKTSKSIVFASLNFNFVNSVSMSCTVFPGENVLSRLLLRIRNESPGEVLIRDISANPSRWVEKHQTELSTSMIQQTCPVLNLFQRSNTFRGDCLNGNGFSTEDCVLSNIPPGGTFQIFLDLKSKDHQTAFTVSKINIILSWVSYLSREKTLHNLEGTRSDILNYSSYPPQSLLSGQVCVYNVNLFDPYSIPFNGCKNNEDKYHPLSISISTKDLSSPDIHFVETNVTITNITISSTIMSSLICNSRPMTCQSLQEDDLLLPCETQFKGQSSKDFSFLSQKSEVPHLSRRVSSVLESGELKWVGPTVTHIKLDPMSSKSLKLIAIVPFKGIFSTNTIQLLIRERYPFFPNHLKSGRKGDPNSNYILTNNNSSSVYFYICYMNWIPQPFVDPNIKLIARYPIKTYQDCLTHTYIRPKSSFSNNGKSKNATSTHHNNRSLLPAYVESRGVNNRKLYMANQSGSSSLSIPNSQEDLLIPEKKDIDKLNALNLEKWLTNEESAYVTSSNVNVTNYSNAYRFLNLPQKYLRRRIITQKPHQSHLLIRI